MDVRATQAYKNSIVDRSPLWLGSTTVKTLSVALRLGLKYVEEIFDKLLLFIHIFF